MNKKMNFAEAIGQNLLLERWEDIIKEHLGKSKAYTDAQANLDSAIEKVEAMILDGSKSDILWELSECYQRVHDIEAQCFYKIGLRDGISINSEQFITSCC